MTRKSSDDAPRNVVRIACLMIGLPPLTTHDTFARPDGQAGGMEEELFDDLVELNGIEPSTS